MRVEHIEIVSRTGSLLNAITKLAIQCQRIVKRNRKFSEHVGISTDVIQ